MEISIILSMLALAISLVSFYYIHIQGPKFRFDMDDHFHTDKKDILETNNFQIKYNFVIINDGNKTGIIKDIRLEIKPDLECQAGPPMTSLPTVDKFGMII